MPAIRRTFVIIALVCLANLFVWYVFNRGTSERPWGGLISSLSYSPYHGEENRKSDEEIDEDLALLAKYSHAIRIYSTIDGLDRIPPIAARHGLEVFAGAWVSKDPAATNKEISGLITMAQANPNVTRVIVGNETLLREDVKLRELIDLIEQVKRQVNVPVSTAEPWHIWIKHPELAQAVDFITVHTLPYWEGVPLGGTIQYVLYRYRQLASAFPDKHIFIGEVGWPSEGQWVKGAEPSQINQAKFIRQFLNMASAERIDYSIIEAFDDPWKRSIEGTVGAYWGLWDVDGNPKFPMSGIVVETTDWMWGFIAASLLAIFPIQWFVRRWSDLRLTGQIFYAVLIQVVFSMLVRAIMAGLNENIISGSTIAWGTLVMAQVVLLVLLLVDGLELTEVMWTNRRRAFKPREWTPPPDAPKVSIHVPCYNEPPHMVMQTLDALARLNYPNFEVLVIDNNTKDEEVWRPLEAYCAKLGPRFRFFHLPKWPGFKAGALNFAISQTANDAEFVGVIDSDYTVSPDWLRSTIPYFEKPEVAIVQCPQDYRDGDEDWFKRMCYWEYAGFFHIGMVQRNERNAIIQHGTMTIIRKTALKQANGWSEWCICEDAEMGLRLFEHGHEAVYMEHSLGRGLIPDSFSGYKTQRFRWAYGAVQILKRHWHEFSDGKHLTRGQRYHFVSGWLPWFADAAHMAFVIAAVFWSILLLFKLVEFPPLVFLVPTLSVFVFKVVAGMWLYHARVPCGWRDRLGAAVAGMSLTHIVGRAVWQGIFTSDKPFFRTPKCEDKPASIQGLIMAKEEITLLAGLIFSAVAVLIKFDVANHTAALWSGMLMVQTLPYLAALYVSMVNVSQKKLAAPACQTA